MSWHAPGWKMLLGERPLHLPDEFHPIHCRQSDKLLQWNLLDVYKYGREHAGANYPLWNHRMTKEKSAFLSDVPHQCADYFQKLIQKENVNDEAIHPSFRVKSALALPFYLRMYSPSLLYSSEMYLPERFYLLEEYYWKVGNFAQVIGWEMKKSALVWLPPECSPQMDSLHLKFEMFP